MTPLLTAIKSAFAGNSTLTAAWTGGLFANRAPETAAMPYLVYFVQAATTTTSYGQKAQDTVVIRFVGTGVGLLATGQNMELLDAAFANTILSLSSGQNFNVMRMTPPTPSMLAGVDKDGNEIWNWSSAYTYSVGY